MSSFSSTNIPPVAEICHIHEDIFSQERKHTKRIRIIGRLQEKDINRHTVVLTSPVTQPNVKHSSVKVCVKLIYPFEARLGSLYETIVEVLQPEEDGNLHAHTWRCMDGLDIIMYYKGIQMRREYFSQQNINQAVPDTG
ncbi:putative CST complex subunit TEN1 [Apostichopus japonicus]|uniref:Putative CST complex subunit TEN1 n=1 Tax=Stichopus japonicus TaxID=307972 RepID=A0A2G8LKI9_STIJA|nr:putative CST complex subunit TEN1 [Apostichopus japonicus]